VKALAHVERRDRNRKPRPINLSHKRHQRLQVRIANTDRHTSSLKSPTIKPLHWTIVSLSDGDMRHACGLLDKASERWRALLIATQHLCALQLTRTNLTALCANHAKCFERLHASLINLVQREAGPNPNAKHQPDREHHREYGRCASIFRRQATQRTANCIS
jgi:hypothetical protein